MCLFCCDILCWFSVITCCGCRDILTRRLVFFPPDAYYDNIGANEKFSEFYHRLSPKPDNNNKDDTKQDQQHHSDDIVLEVCTNKTKHHQIKSSTSVEQHEMERLNSSDDTLSYEQTNSTKPNTNNLKQTAPTNNATNTIDRNTFGTFRIKDDDINLAKFYWNNYALKMSNFQHKYLTTKRGTTIASYYMKHASSTYTILFSHGNAADIGLMRNHLCRMYQKCKVSIFAYEYSGYGKSDGKASEKNTYADVERAYQEMTETLRIKPSRIILYGQSLGTCVSVYLATRFPVAGVILHSPLMSGLRVMQHFDKTYWFDIYPVVEQIQHVFAPIFVIHGNRDKEIDVIHGKILSRLAPNSYPPWFVPYAGHNDIEVMFPDVLFKKISKFIKHLKNLERTYLNDGMMQHSHALDAEGGQEEDEDMIGGDQTNDDDEEEEEQTNDDTDMTRFKRINAAHLAKSVTHKNTDQSLSPPPPQSLMTASQDRDRIRHITLPSRKFSNTGNSMVDDEESVLKTPSVAASLSIKDSNFISISMKDDKSAIKGYDTVLTPTMRTIHSVEQSASDLALPNTMEESHTMSTVNNLKKKSRKSRKNLVVSHPDIDEEKDDTSRHKKSKKRRKKEVTQRLIIPTSDKMTENIDMCYQRIDRLMIEANDTASCSSSEDIGILVDDNDGESSSSDNVECDDNEHDKKHKRKK